MKFNHSNLPIYLVCYLKCSKQSILDLKDHPNWIFDYFQDKGIAMLGISEDLLYL